MESNGHSRKMFMGSLYPYPECAGGSTSLQAHFWVLHSIATRRYHSSRHYSMGTSYSLNKRTSRNEYLRFLYIHVTMELHEIIKQSINQFGRDIIADIKFFYILSDFGAYREMPEIRNIVRDMIEHGYMDRIKKIDNPSWIGTLFKKQLSNTERLNEINTIKHDFISEYGYSADHVNQFICALTYGMGLTSTIPQTANTKSVKLPSSKAASPTRPVVNATQVGNSFSTSSITDTQFMIVRVEPSDSILYVNDNQVPLTNGCWVDELKVGQYKIDVVPNSSDYLSFSKNVDLTIQKKLELSIKLKEKNPLTPVFILCGDDKCKVFIDGVLVGSSPWSGEVRVGAHEVEVRRDGYKPLITTINVVDNNLKLYQRQQFKLEPKVPMIGAIKVNSYNVGDSVYFDGKDVGTTPLILRDIFAGKHRISIDVRGVKYDKLVEVEDNRMTAVDFFDGVEVISCDNPHMRNEISVKGKTHDICFTIGGVDFCMKYVQGGSFMMGATSGQILLCDKNEYPAHRIAVNSLFIGQTQVTQKQWQAIMKSNPSRKQSEQLPVDNVSWTDCHQFIDRLNKLTGLKFRLPTEAEWEYCARGGINQNNYIYSGSDKIKEVAWCKAQNKGRCGVALLKPNQLGLYDMSGNVWEWCEDEFAPYIGVKPYTPVKEYVLRGGSSASSETYCRVSARGSSQDKKGYNDGLRLVLQIQ